MITDGVEGEDAAAGLVLRLESPGIAPLVDVQVIRGDRHVQALARTLMRLRPAIVVSELSVADTTALRRASADADRIVWLSATSEYETAADIDAMAVLTLGDRDTQHGEGAGHFARGHGESAVLFAHESQARVLAGFVTVFGDDGIAGLCYVPTGATVQHAKQCTGVDWPSIDLALIALPAVTGTDLQRLFESLPGITVLLVSDFVEFAGLDDDLRNRTYWMTDYAHFFAADFHAAYTRAYGEEPTVEAALGYDVGTLIADALRRAQTREAAELTRALRTSEADLMSGPAPFQLFMRLRAVYAVPMHAPEDVERVQFILK